MKKLITLFAVLVCISSVSATSIMPNSINVSFTSIGTGIDIEAYNNVLEIISREVARGNVSQFIQKHTGREGERDLCVAVDAYTSDRRLIWNLMKEIRTITDSSNLIKAYHGLNCR